LSDAAWLHLVEAFVEGRIDVNAFHDRFFEQWHAQPRFGPFCPKAIEQLFITVEAYCPDPALRDPGSLYEADEAEVCKDAEIALARLKADRQ
jgi:hypothetical protein